MKTLNDLGNANLGDDDVEDGNLGILLRRYDPCADDLKDDSFLDR
jgi:hypothetical protein